MTEPTPPAQPHDPAGNPLLTESDLAFGLPPFDRIRVEHFRPALEAGMAAQLTEIEAIVANPDRPEAANTLVGLERSGQLLDRAAAVFYNLCSSLSTDELRAVEREMAPQMAAHRDAILLHPGLFARIDAVAAELAGSGAGAGGSTTEGVAGADPATRYLAERRRLEFVLAGAALDADARAELAALNQQLSVRITEFQQRLQLAMEAAAMHLTDVEELSGMPADAVAAARAAAEARGLDGYLLPLVLPSGQPALANLDRRDVRERLHRASVERASVGEADTAPLAVEIARIRAQRARLLGFDNHAALSVADQTARSTAAIDELLDRLTGPAAANARAEAATLAELAGRDGIDLQAWDWAYYSEKARVELFSVDEAALRPFFRLDRVLTDGVFRAAQQLYGITLTPRPDLVGYHPDVRVFEVADADGTPIGLYLGDFFARDGKRGGAWMSSFVDQSDLLGHRPVVLNNLNVPPPPAGEPAFLTLDEVRTLFHEFGHALHGLLSRVQYPSQSGTAVPRDFVEYPSQVNEMWMLWPELLRGYAIHAETGQPIPQQQVDAMRAAERWGQGFATFEFLAATHLDQAWHRITPETVIESVDDFERAALAGAGLDMELIPPRYRTRYFLHVFAGPYSAGYYSYVWAEVLDADTVDWFVERGGLLRSSGDAFRAVLAAGGSVDPLVAFRALRGRNADVGPLLRRRGLDRPGRLVGAAG